jgi:flagellar assembly protein FliH
MSSSPDPGRARVLRDARATPVRGPELPTGTWTRFGGSSVLGDTVTEDALSTLADTASAAARAQGYAVGWAEGRRAAADGALERARIHAAQVEANEARREVEHQEALARLDAAARALDEAVSGAERAVGDRALALASELTALLVGHELRTTPDSGGDAVRRALVLTSDQPVTVVRLSPHDAGTPAAGDLADQGLRVLADPALARVREALVSA